MDKDITRAVGHGLKLLPFIVKSVEALFGKKNGKSKKQAVHDLTNAAIAGAALGFGVTGDTEIQNTLTQLRPVISTSIDAIVDGFNSDGTFASN